MVIELATGVAGLIYGAAGVIQHNQDTGTPSGTLTVSRTVATTPLLVTTT